MVTATDINFWTGYSVSDEEASRYSEIAEAHLNSDGGQYLTGELRTEALCYFIASRISNKTDSGIVSESVGGYSYSKKSPNTSSRWLDLYFELIPRGVVGAATAMTSNAAKRVDRHMVTMNRRY